MIGTNQEMLLYFFSQKSTKRKLALSHPQFLRQRRRIACGEIGEDTCNQLLTHLGCTLIRPAVACPGVFRNPNNGRTYTEKGVIALAKSRRMNVRSYVSPSTCMIRWPRMLDLAGRLGLDVLVERETLPSVWNYNGLISNDSRQLKYVPNILGLSLDSKVEC